MHDDYLIRMANDIANFFASEPDPHEAARSVASHIKRFWDPRMRAQIISILRKGGAGLNELAASGVNVLAEDTQRSEPVR